MPVRYLGIDVGTSGVRACVIDSRGEPLVQAEAALPAPRRDGNAVGQDPEIWWHALEDVLDTMAGDGALREVQAIAVDGTSATLLAADADGTPLAPALMYNDGRGQDAARRIAAVAPSTSASHGPSSSLSKALWLLGQSATAGCRFLLHQADWLAGRLTGRFGRSDENNALKLGYDPVARAWPDWMAPLGVPPSVLPDVTIPGASLGPLAATWARRWDMPGARVVAGTTDSTAAFLATRATHIGQAVTSLGSTLVLKVLSEQPVFVPEYGVYSHRIGERWLVGGASNSGGAVLRRFFTDAQLRILEARVRPDEPTGLDYYPLPAVGERFPRNDPGFRPRLTPRPTDDARFLQGILEGIADIERRGYALLHDLGAPYPSEVISVGGGAANAPWRTLRAERLGVPVRVAAHQDAAYGAALLAQHGFSTYR